MTPQEKKLRKLIEECSCKTEPLEELYFSTQSIPSDSFDSLAKSIIKAFPQLSAKKVWTGTADVLCIEDMHELFDPYEEGKIQLFIRETKGG